MKKNISVIFTVLLMGVMAAICCAGQLLPNLQRLVAQTSISMVLVVIVSTMAAIMGFAALTASGKAPKE